MDFKVIYLATRNPAISPEDWPRTWRSHAIFASQFGSAGQATRMVRYCSRAFAFTPPGATTTYDGVGVLSFDKREDMVIKRPPEIAAQIANDELRVFAAPTATFWFEARQVLVHGAANAKAAVIRFLARKAGTSPEDFQRNWNERHAPLAARTGDASGLVRGYVHNALISPPPPGYPFDGISEQWFDAPEDAAQAFGPGALSSITTDLAQFCDMTKSVTILTHVTHLWPRPS